ncbi:MAG TPA: hypothetical protein VGO37_06060 [Steroidobacteraceae bacterium]|jgi:hypothetical protein|nr:hypothetical protein [Steroidobacteraceae bacterium]
MNAVTTINPSDARLPATYEAARTAIAECERLDECKTWADQAAAMKAYAVMRDDRTLHNTALRIQLRAERRLGELLKQIPSATGAHLKSTGTDTLSRKQAATDAGLSKRQQVTALRVASVPAADFDSQVDSENPPTVTQLAMQGTRESSGSISPWAAIEDADIRAACETLAAFARFCERTPLEGICKTLNENEAIAVMDLICIVSPWLEQLMTGLGSNEF